VRILKIIDERDHTPPFYLQIEGPDDGGVAGIQINNVYVEASTLTRAWEEYHQVEYQESPFESFMGAVNVAMTLENQFQQYGGTQLVTIVGVFRSQQTGTYGVEIAIAGEGELTHTLWRNRDVTAIRAKLNDLRYKPRDSE